MTDTTTTTTILELAALAARVGPSASQQASSLADEGLPPDAIDGYIAATGTARHAARVRAMKGWLAGFRSDGLGLYYVGLAVIAGGSNGHDVPFAPAIVPVPARRGRQGGVWDAALKEALSAQLSEGDAVTSVAYVAVVGSETAARIALQYLGSQLASIDADCSWRRVVVAACRAAADMRVELMDRMDSETDCCGGESHRSVVELVEDGAYDATPPQWVGVHTDLCGRLAPVLRAHYTGGVA